MPQNVSRTIRVRAGLYLTPDAKYRILRRTNPLTQRKRWFVQLWDAEMGYYADVRHFPTLAAARKFVSQRTEPAF